MATGANISEIHSISDARTGTIRVSRLALTGWANAAPSASVGFKTWSDDGRMWAVYTSSTADLSFYRRSTVGSGDKVCSGTVSSGKVTLSQANTSGFSGTADVDNGTPGTNPTADATFDVVVSYADENDLVRADRNVTSYLVSNLYPGGASGTRWESVLADAKRIVDADNLRMYEPRMRYDTWGRPMLAHIVKVGDFAKAHAHRVLHICASNRGKVFYEEAAFHDNEANKALARVGVDFDYERDLQPDNGESGNVAQLFRR